MADSTLPGSADVWACADAVRRGGPLVHNVTNYVAMDLSANALLAVGASPAMVHAHEEVVDFALLADALVVNIGTLSPNWVESMRLAVRAATDRGIPWVLDPVAAGATSYRTQVGAELLAHRPTVVRGNASEILSLAGMTGRGKGVDATDESGDALEAAVALAQVTGGVVAVTGDVDVVTDRRRTAHVAGGHPLMARVTAMGCAASAVVGAYAAAVADPLMATASALAVFGLAGERAATGAVGPGTLRWRLLDELYALEQSTVLAGTRIS
ncbi:hydroxyethylthiazole kinase [Actinobacteria bacterium YIM 96077]|uniref:Hydroxyethylthiazole kinase n=1 Tax=Phytoactinopolyspora halophila TaxID=1981511 RepID=A0A329QB26_9ACTN|nr:hydroxyethylthiazole kinase [Phytoactinopolyspora halophila]AYY15318.1 hydroxyethylthiazole kinase [Actinobacteria bacterium YIM 96077]RAW09437.1 hydroxyethylthiazole kinase [Phytoactinopolyspora halophila]